MGWDSSTKILTLKTVGGVKIGNGYLGDLETALGRTCKDHIQLICDYDSSSNRVSYINKWAKYQPFAMSTIYSDYYSDSNSQRLAGLKAANWGFGANGIPTYSTASTLLTAMQNIKNNSLSGKHWTRTKPTATAAGGYARFLDFDGYAGVGKVEAEWGVLGGSNGRLNAPFGAYVETSAGAYVMGPYDVLKRVSIDVTDPDNGATGLLYPGDFTSMNTGLYSFADWYLGVALAKSDFTALYMVTDTQKMSAYGSGDYPLLQNILWQYGSSAFFGSSSYYLFPVLTLERLSSTTATRFTSMSSWTSESTLVKRAVLLDGYYMLLTSSNNKTALVFNVTYTIASGKTTISMTVTNYTGSAMTIAANMFALLTSEASFDSSDYNDYVVPRWEAWVNSGSNPGTDVTNASSKTVARYVNFGNSATTVAANGGTASFSKQINYTSDYYGSYNKYANVDICYTRTVGGTSERIHQ